ncbi:MAG: AzlD domain-containing protein, partial [Peptococcaceae bacterium]|nr:AzlD domain-containing protein [Peptococcaceae bacterium]
MIRMEVLLIILGMTAVTYIPRALPAVILDKLKFSAKVEKFLKLIPYTAM